MKHEWLLKRNCSMTPRQVAKAYGMLCTGVLGVSLAFALQGIWIVFAFAVLEITVVVTALLYYARHALDQERVCLSEGRLHIERTDAGRVEHFVLDPHLTRIVVPDRRRQLIALESKGVKIELGSYVSETARRAVARELKARLPRGLHS
jgi:uncharacterized membrane protein